MHEHTAELLGGSEKRRRRRRRGPALLPGYNVFFQRSNTKTCQFIFFAIHEQRQVHYKHIVKPFLANRERRHVHYKDIVKPFFCNSRQRYVQYKHFVKSFFFANHELKDMSITNLKTDQERKTLGMILSTIRKVERL
jgi:hypothetical protein